MIGGTGAQIGCAAEGKGAGDGEAELAGRMAGAVRCFVAGVEHSEASAGS